MPSRCLKSRGGQVGRQAPQGHCDETSDGTSAKGWNASLKKQHPSENQQAGKMNQGWEKTEPVLRREKAKPQGQGAYQGGSVFDKARPWRAGCSPGGR